MKTHLAIGGIAAAAVIAGTIGGVAVASPTSTPTKTPGAGQPSATAAPTYPTKPSAATHIDPKTGKPVLDGPAPDDQAVAALATDLHITHAKAVDVLAALNQLARPGQGVDPTSSAFRKLATSLHLTPGALAAALDAWKRGLTHEPPSPSPAAPTQSASPSPSKS